jgi:hypothetical protein
MKTLGSLLVIVLGMTFVLPKVTAPEKKMEIPMDIIIPYQEEPDIKARKQKIQLLKSHIGILISEIKLKMPNDESK